MNINQYQSIPINIYKYPLISIFFICIISINSYISIGFSYAQTDSITKNKLVKYSPEFQFKEGIYISFEQVKYNSPVPKPKIDTHIPQNDFDYFSNLISEEKIFFYDDFGIKQEVLSKNIWGYSKNGTLFINYNDEFNRIPVVGSICHFVANVTVYQDRFFDPYDNPYNYSMRLPTYAYDELRQYILDFETGKVMDYNIHNLSTIFMRDTELYDEYNDLKKRKKKQLMFFYLRRFNEKNLLYLPVN